MVAAVVCRIVAVATAAEQDQQDDDPAQIAATETITSTTHKEYLQFIDAVFAAHSMVFRPAGFVQLTGWALPLFSLSVYQSRMR